MVLKRALLVGPSYAADLPFNLHQLPGVQNDLKLMECMLRKQGFQPEHIKVLEGNNATYSNILEALEEVSSEAPIKSVVVIYFSGHGFYLDGEFDQGFVPADLTAEMVHQYKLYDKCITGEHYKHHLVKLNQKEVLVNTIFDCCFSGRMYRGFPETDHTSQKAVRQLTLPEEYVSNYCKFLKSKSPWQVPASLKSKTEPVEQDESERGDDNEELPSPIQETQPMDQAPSQETQPHNPALVLQLLSFPAQEFWTTSLKSKGWSPSFNDRFFHIGASSATEKAYEDIDPRTGEVCGNLTAALVEVIDEVPAGQKLSYNCLRSLIKRKFSQRKITNQTPQFEGGNMDSVIFGFETVSKPVMIEVVKVVETGGIQSSVVLSAGSLHSFVDGEYDLYEPTVTKEIAQLQLGEDNNHWVGRVDVNQENIHMLTSEGIVLLMRVKIQVGCKAYLSRRGSVRNPVIIKPPRQDSLERLRYFLDREHMFTVLTEQPQKDTIFIDAEEMNGESYWRARQNETMIVPHQQLGNEEAMAENLTKYVRFKMASELLPPSGNMLKNVAIKLFKLENVPPFFKNPDKKNELIGQAVSSPDLYEGDPPFTVPSFRAHRVELVKKGRSEKYKAVDNTGDAFVIQITNNELEEVHVCVLSFQADGSVIALHPPKRGATVVLTPGETVTEIRRILLEPDTARRMKEPDLRKEDPAGCNDIIMLYATTKATDYGPLLQSPIELDQSLRPRGNLEPEGKLLYPLDEFRAALKPDLDERDDVRTGEIKWLTVRREIEVLCNEEQNSPEL